MNQLFPLFKSHIDLAHHYWSLLLEIGDTTVIDATCGNGHDTLFLARQCLRRDRGQLITLDIQVKALNQAKELLFSEVSEEILSRIHFINQCHSVFPISLIENPVKLIVYNLGYLPKGEKSITTMVDTTLLSIHAALQLIAPRGVISITCYPGHEEGRKEQEVIINLVESLDPKEWNCCLHQWINRTSAPGLLLIQKSSRIC